MEMKTIDAKQCTAIALGRLGENEYTVVRFDVSAWLEALPGAVIGLYNQRPGDADAYPIAAIAVEDGVVTWTVTSAELTQTGEGRCELVAIAGDVVAKSAIFRTIVFDALDGSGEAPEPWADWQQQFIILKGEAEQAAERAEEAVEHYPRIVDGVWEVWDGATEQWVSTGVQAQGPQGEPGEQGEPGSRGETGETGAAGADGFSPVATVTQTASGATISITDKTGTTTADIANGQDGAQGAPGQPGQDGVSPSITITDIAGGHRVTITDADGVHSFDVMNGEGAVQDVQVNGVSVLNDGVANVPKSSTSVYGVVKSGAYGIANDNGELKIQRPSDAEVKAGNGTWRVLNPAQQHQSTFYGLAKAAGDTTQSASSNAVGTYTDEAKVAIQKMLGVYREWELIADETVAEDSEIYNVTTDISGQPFELSEMYVRVWLKPSTTGTADYVSAQNLLVTKSDATSSSAAPTKKYLSNGAATFIDYRCEIVGGVAYSTAAATNSPNSTGTVERICSANDTFKAFRGFKLQKYSTNTSLIPKDTVIKIYGIRA